MKLALVSNAPKEDARNSLESLGLSEAFDPMVFAQDIGADKPDPASYLAALHQLEISPEEGLAFEDSPDGAAAAVKAGIPTVGLSSTHGPGELRQAGVGVAVGDFADPAVYERLGR